MADMKIEDKIFIKQIIDEYNYLCYNSNEFSRCVVRRVPGAAMKGSDLKELSVITRSTMLNNSTDIYKLFTAYKNRMKPNASLKDVATEIYNIHANVDDRKNESYIAEPLSKAVSTINSILRIINSQIEFIRTSYKVADSNDERYNKATVKSIFKINEESNMYNSDLCTWGEIEKIEKDLNAKKIDPYSPEYGKLIIKRLNTFKADIISAFNKYYGKNSVFAEFNLSDMIR